MEGKENLNEMTIIYKIDENKENIRIFGCLDGGEKHFIEKNKNKCFILIERKKYDLIDEIELNKNLKNKKTL
jgi:hypothetical protein